MSTDLFTGPKKRIVITGGSGVVGRTAIEKLLSYGHEILNVDQTPLDNPNVHTLKADLTDGAQAFNALSCHFKIGEPFLDELRTPDVVIHLAGTYWDMVSGVKIAFAETIIPAQLKTNLNLATSIHKTAARLCDANTNHPSIHPQNHG
jgi:nucleoside-diphosphate-sugar epimerase